MTEEQRDKIETATVTVGRAKRFYALLCDLDFDEAYDEAQAEADAEVTGEPTGIAEQADHDEGDSTATVRLNMEGLTETLMTEGKLEEMAEVVLDIPETVDVDDVPVLMIVEGLADFIPAYGRLFAALVGTSSATVSTLNGTD
jgi:hypothetical protein